MPRARPCPHTLISLSATLCMALLLWSIDLRAGLGMIAVSLCLAAACDPRARTALSLLSAAVLTGQVALMHSELSAMSAALPGVLLAGCAWPLLCLRSRHRAH